MVDTDAVIWVVKHSMMGINKGRMVFVFLRIVSKEKCNSFMTLFGYFRTAMINRSFLVVEFFFIKQYA